MMVVIVDVPWVPCTTCTEVGEADIRKFGANETWEIPRKAIVVISPVLLGAPTTTVSREPETASCLVILLQASSRLTSYSALHHRRTPDSLVLI